MRIGSVAAITIAPDARHVDIAMAIERDWSRRLDLARLAPTLRARLGTTGITGVKYIDIDYVGPEAAPPPRLSFTTARHYIPATKSLLGSIEANLERMAEELPKMVDRATSSLAKLDAILAEVHDQRVVARIAGAIEDARRLIRHVDRGTVARLDNVLGQLSGAHGLIASAHRATDALGDFGRSAARSTDNIDRTIRDIGDAARAVRILAQDIDRQPDILVKGRARTGR